MRLLTLAALALGSAPAAAEQVEPVAPKPMRRVAPALADYTDRLLFGDVWKRPELSPRDRSLVTITVLIAAGESAPLASHLERALDNGVTPAKIGGTITHLAFYAERRANLFTIARSAGMFEAGMNPPSVGWGGCQPSVASALSISPRYIDDNILLADPRLSVVLE